MYEIEEAYAYAQAGGEALHLHNIVFDRAPQCFKQAVHLRGEWIAHLFDQNADRLRAWAKWAGVRVVVLEREGTHRQHLDLCGVPLAKVIAQLTDEERQKVPPAPGRPR